MARAPVTRPQKAVSQKGPATAVAELDKGRKIVEEEEIFDSDEVEEELVGEEHDSESGDEEVGHSSDNAGEESDAVDDDDDDDGSDDQDSASDGSEGDDEEDDSNNDSNDDRDDGHGKKGKHGKETSFPGRASSLADAFQTVLSQKVKTAAQPKPANVPAAEASAVPAASHAGSLIFSRRRGPERKLEEEKLEKNAQAILRAERKARRDQQHRIVPDPSTANMERVLRKTATKGVVHLFNAVQKNHEVQETMSARKRARLAAKAKSNLDDLHKGDDNGDGNNDDLEDDVKNLPKSGFLELLKSSTTTASSTAQMIAATTPHPVITTSSLTNVNRSKSKKY